MPDETTATRLLRLLPLLTSRRAWRGDELAARLGVTPRTVRRDIDRLRDLGYEIRAAPGVHGGYTLGPGAQKMPPLLLDDDAAVAVAVALAAVPTEAARRAAAAIDQVLPARLRPRVEAVTATTVPLSAPELHQNELAFLAQACSRAERLRFQYSDGAGNQSSRHVEPYRLVSTGRRWYLVARDLAKGEWRSFRLDRISAPQDTGIRSRPADPPDPAKFVSAGISSGPYYWHAKVLLEAPAEVVAARVPATVAVIEALTPDTCVLTTGAHDLDFIAMRLAALDIPFTPLDPPELRSRCAVMAARLSQAAASRLTSMNPKSAQATTQEPLPKIIAAVFRVHHPHARASVHTPAMPNRQGLPPRPLHSPGTKVSPSSTGMGRLCTWRSTAPRRYGSLSWAVRKERIRIGQGPRWGGRATRRSQ